MTRNILFLAALVSLTVNFAVALLSIEDICKQTPGMTLWGEIMRKNPSILALYNSKPNITLYIPSNDAIKAAGFQFSSLSRRDGASSAGYSAATSYNTISNMASDTPQDTLQAGDNGNSLKNVGGPGPSTPPRLAKRQEAPAPEPPGTQVYTGFGNASKILYGDILCTQGIAHVVDTVFTLPVRAAETLKALFLKKFLDAITDAGLTSKIEGADQITMFVPQDAGIEGELDADAIEHHIVYGTSLFGNSLFDGNKIKTASGEELCVTVKGTTIYIDDVEVVQKNIILRNGVAHVIAKSLCECDECEPHPVHTEVTYTHKVATATPVYHTYRA